jgi:hypothetical protein
MRKRIDGKYCDTETATNLGTKYVGEFGQADGYEEALYVTKTKQHFIYGIGGAESKYTEPAIELCTEKQANDWLKANKKDMPKDDVKIKSKKPVTTPAAKNETTRKKPRNYTPEDKVFIADKNNPIETVMEKYGYDKTTAHKMRAHFAKDKKAAEDK